MGFHAFTGSDYTPTFKDKGKMMKGLKNYCQDNQLVLDLDAMLGEPADDE